MGILKNNFVWKISTKYYENLYFGKSIWKYENIVEWTNIHE